MKKLNTNNVGRMPLWEADLDWMQAGYTEPITALVAELGLSKSYFAITGCVPYKPDIKTLAMPAGWFWWNGQILPVRALQATDVLSFTNPVVRLTKVTYTNPDGARGFIKTDLTTQQVSDVWQDDYLTPTVVERSAAFTAGVRLGIGAWTLRDILLHHNAENESGWISGESGDLEFKRVGRMVVLRGIATNVTTTMQAVDTGFPVPISGDAVLHLATQPDDLNIRIGSNGQLYCWSQTGGQGDPLLTGMMYMAATPYQETDPNTINDNPQS